jgi:hypothetical protein
MLLSLEGQRVKPGSFPKISAVSEIADEWKEKYFHFFLVKLTGKVTVKSKL